MVRGPKKHMKRLAAPKSWMLEKLGGVYSCKPSSGPHKQGEFVFFAISTFISTTFLPLHRSILKISVVPIFLLTQTFYSLLQLKNKLVVKTSKVFSNYQMRINLLN